MMTSLNELQTEYLRKNNAFQQRLGEKRSLEKRQSGLDTEIEELRLDAATTEKAVWLLQQYADHQQKEVITKIEDVVTSGLQAVFRNSTLSFKLFYSQTKSGAKKRAPEITMAVYYDYGGNEVKGDIKNSFGGGLSVVVSSLLRVIMVWFLKDQVRPILFLDEPLKDLSPEYPDQPDDSSGYRDRMAEFLKKLTSDAGVQIIMVSHESNYAEEADVDYRFHGSIGKSPKVTKNTKTEIDGGM
jgi:DNA repair exonuclease SbcCD ATPase subunit